MPSINNRSSRYNTSGVRRCRSEIEATQNRALELRTTTSMTLREIAQACGYVNPTTGEPRPQSADMAIRAAQARLATNTTTVTRPVVAPTNRTTPRTRRVANTMPSTRTFGVEIEFVGNERLAIDALAQAGIACTYEGYTHAVMPDWKIVTDGSVSGNGRGLELVSPILRGQAGIEAVEKALTALRASGARVNTTCGVHVHVGMDGLVGAQLMQVIDLYHSNQSHINNLVSRSRRNSRWAKPFSNAVLNGGSNGFIYANLRGSRTATATAGHRASTSRADRYYAINVCSYAKYGTLEFRQHQGSLNGKKVTSWVKFVLALVEKATAESVTTQFATADEFIDSLALQRGTKTYLKARHAALSAGGRA